MPNLILIKVMMDSRNTKNSFNCNQEITSAHYSMHGGDAKRWYCDDSLGIILLF